MNPGLQVYSLVSLPMSHHYSLYEPPLLPNELPLLPIEPPLLPPLDGKLCKTKFFQKNIIQKA
jgi:hypothetical protein